MSEVDAGGLKTIHRHRHQDAARQDPAHREPMRACSVAGMHREGRIPRGKREPVVISTD